MRGKNIVAAQLYTEAPITRHYLKMTDKNELFISLSEAIFRLAVAKGAWPNTTAAKNDMINAALEGKITIYGQQRYLKECEAVPAYAFIKPLTLPLLDLHSLVKTPKSIHIGRFLRVKMMIELEINGEDFLVCLKVSCYQL